jgi:hypothetical protein
LLCSPQSTTSEADLCALLLRMPAHRRGEAIRAVLFGSADESQLPDASLLKAAFSAHSQENFGEVPSVEVIAEGLANPLLVKLVMAFNCLIYVSNEEEMSAAVKDFPTRGTVSPTNSWWESMKGTSPSDSLMTAGLAKYSSRLPSAAA